MSFNTNIWQWVVSTVVGMHNENSMFFRKFLVQIFRDYTMLVAAINNGVSACEHT